MGDLFWIGHIARNRQALATQGVNFVKLLDTQGAAVTYNPERLSMERSATAFTATDRIGQLQVQINDIEDSRRMLEEQRKLRLSPARPPSDPLELGS